MVAPIFDQKIGEDQKKGLPCKTSWFSVRKYVITKEKRSSSTNQWVFGLKSKKNKQMVSPRNGDTRGGPPPPPLATPLHFIHPSCLGQETAKGPFRLRVKLPPVYHTRRRLPTVPLIAERQAGKL